MLQQNQTSGPQKHLNLKNFKTMKNVKLIKLTQNMQKNTPVIRDKMN